MRVRPLQHLFFEGIYYFTSSLSLHFLLSARCLLHSRSRNEPEVALANRNSERRPQQPTEPSDNYPEIPQRAHVFVKSEAMTQLGVT